MFQANRSAEMQLLGADGYFGAKAEFSPIGKPGGGIVINSRTIHLLLKFYGLLLIARNNGGGMFTGVFINMVLIASSKFWTMAKRIFSA